MKILAIERELPGTTAEQFQRYLKQEALRVWELHQAGIIRELYFREDKSNAVLILECTDKNMAEDVLNSLPLVKEQLITFEIIPLMPYPGFSRLFAEA
jgi:muconolactone delta-isomerase